MPISPLSLSISTFISLSDPNLDYYVSVQQNDRHHDDYYDDDPYLISATFTEGVDGYETEENDEIHQADTLSFNNPVTGVISDTDDYDWYVFDVAAPGILTVDLNSVGDNYYNYFDVSVYNSDIDNPSFAHLNKLSGRRGSGVESGEGDLAFQLAAPDPGLYYIRVTDTYQDTQYGQAHKTDPYDLSVSLQEGPLTSFVYDYETEDNDTANLSADLLTFGKSAYGSLSHGGDQDFYKLDVIALNLNIAL